MTKWLPTLTPGGRRPMFVFIDPFGYSDLPMNRIARIARVPHSECLINFTYKSINRWSGHGDPKKEAHLDALYGSSQWRTRWGSEDAMVDFYRDQLVALGGFRYICAFKPIFSSLETLNAGSSRSRRGGRRTRRAGPTLPWPQRPKTCGASSRTSYSTMS